MKKGHFKFLISVQIGLKAKVKKDGQDHVISSFKKYFLVKNEIIYLISKNGLFDPFPLKNIIFQFCQGNYA